MRLGYGYLVRGSRMPVISEGSFLWFCYVSKQKAAAPVSRRHAGGGGRGEPCSCGSAVKRVKDSGASAASVGAYRLPEIQARRPLAVRVPGRSFQRACLHLEVLDERLAGRDQAAQRHPRQPSLEAWVLTFIGEGLWAHRELNSNIPDRPFLRP